MLGWGSSTQCFFLLAKRGVGNNRFPPKNSMVPAKTKMARGQTMFMNRVIRGEPSKWAPPFPGHESRQNLIFRATNLDRKVGGCFLRFCGSRVQGTI